MKNYIILSFVLFICVHVQAQETIARFKYEDAEKAFVANNYQECIDNLDEAEKLLGKSAPNILHLKILAQHKLFEKKPYESYEALETLRNNCNTYLTNYDIAGLEEKYREVYTISGSLPKISSQKEMDEFRIANKKKERAERLGEGIQRHNMVFVRGGTFDMGEGSDVREVRLHDFYIGKYEVTAYEYGLYIEEHPKKTIRTPVGNLKPIADVSWDEAMDYCRWLSQRYGGVWRLPTEAEWEYAALGGQRSKGFKFSGSDVWEQVGHLQGGAWTKNGQWEVGSLGANELGIHDMTGNVWEWCHDWFDKNYWKQAPVDNPTGPDSGNYHSIRGGSWSNFGGARIKIKKRESSKSEYANDIGFRVVYIPD
ncbi:SUMF1/EgtB/PvdO family nonheme iron enzyme [Allomuricauda taeanensis]|uniref:formylglycine-generating enzyme family protein n=1 Tax=Flagellimonas taeanensis TaxID=1005926 RepID=UPI002E7C3874|nr:SUMF1/EgtB/PvdO family nonheme iron enzyme [Allomuricauda taeanensis]MEE1963940.1 SUMF1/EgtB/PvdO family nonheme iron enzyme [Allomuricauda taeanensis]